MSADEYTPTTDEIRRGYAETIDALGGRHLGYSQFDRWLAQHEAKIRAEALAGAIQAHRDLHPTYGSTAGCGGGIGGQVMTQHCAVVCDNPAHDKAREAWYLVERAYFEREHLAAPEVTVEDVARVIAEHMPVRCGASKIQDAMLAEVLLARFTITKKEAEQ